MMQSLAVVRTGLEGSQTKMDVISNNLANINTAGFKKMRPIFTDLLYQNRRSPAASPRRRPTIPPGLQLGTGANVVATEPIVTQGSLEQTGNALDLAINGQGYFQILLPTGQLAYTRDGSFQISAQGQVVTSKGNQLQPSITIPRGATSVTVGTDGTVSVQMQNQPNPSQVGLIQLANFINPAGLQNIGGNLALQTQASGAPIVGQPTQNGLGVGGARLSRRVQCVGRRRDDRHDRDAARLRTQHAGGKGRRSDAELPDPGGAVSHRRWVSSSAVLLALGGGLVGCQQPATQESMLASLADLPGDKGTQLASTNGAIYQGNVQGAGLRIVSRPPRLAGR